jgi:acetylornithine deacetylase/succinyl-diaminopimelate desuccinylase-like protein
MKRILIACTALITVCLSAQAQSELCSVAAATKLAQSSFPEYLRFLAMPSDSAVPEDIQKNAAFLEDAFRQRGFTVSQLANDGKPLVFAEYATKIAGAKTVLFYMHLDSQPVVASEWAQKSPWTPVLKLKNAKGQWEEVPQDLLFKSPLDPDLRVFGRSSSDDKGPIMMFLAAFDGMNAAHAKPSVNVKVLIDSQEEVGSPAMAEIINRHLAQLRSDAIIIHDGPRHASNRPTLIFGNRGAAPVTLTVFGPYSPLHSGHYGNYVPNPAMRLAQLLATMKDDRGRVLVKGYYDGIVLTAADKQAFADTGDDEKAILKRTGIARAEAVGSSYQAALQYPSLNIRGMAAASIGSKAANIVPSLAIAELDLRTTPEATPEHLYDLLKKHIEDQGYHLVTGTPTEADRANFDKIASLTLGRGGRAVRTPLDSNLGQWAYKILKTTAPEMNPVRIRMMGGSVPTDSMVDTLKAPFVIIPLVNGDNNQHTYDENMRIGHYVEGIRTILGLLRTPY